MKKIFIIILLAVSATFFVSGGVSAAGLKMQPLMYEDVLKVGENKKGFVDVSNPTTTTLKLKTSVQAFKQIDNNGTLQFSDSTKITAGLIPDLNEFELAPREAIRLYFVLKGDALPSGDVFAALFVSTVDTGSIGVVPSVRLGTLFRLENGTPVSHKAEIESVSMPFFHFGQAISGTYVIKNTAKSGEATGFFPKVTIGVQPFESSQTVKSSLLFAGLARSNDFRVQEERFGFYNVSVKFGDSQKTQWVFMATGIWFKVLVGIAAGLLLGILYISHRLWHRSKKRTKSSK